MLTRRDFSALGLALAASALGPRGARAQDAAAATAFVQQLGDRLVAAVNGPGTEAEKKAELAPVIEQSVDVDSIARFCLGRYVRSATPAQLQEYIQLFRRVLLNNIFGKLGEFRGITYSLTTNQVRENEVLVGTIIRRPNQQPASVQWVVDGHSGQPRIIDVVAEGTSLRLTQRSDYASFISRNGDDVGALITAMRRQVGG